MANVYEKIRISFEGEFNRQKAAAEAYEKIKTNHLLVPNSREFKEFRNQETLAICLGISISLFSAFVFAKRTVSRFCVGGFGLILIKSVVEPYFQSRAVEIIAEKPNEAGQTVRAVILFKYPKHPLADHYTELSQNYRVYQLRKYKEESGQYEEE